MQAELPRRARHVSRQDCAACGLCLSDPADLDVKLVFELLLCWHIVNVAAG
jgi:hypothetical protein